MFRCGNNPQENARAESVDQKSKKREIVENFGSLKRGCERGAWYWVGVVPYIHCTWGGGGETLREIVGIWGRGHETRCRSGKWRFGKTGVSGLWFLLQDWAFARRRGEWRMGEGGTGIP